MSSSITSAESVQQGRGYVLQIPVEKVLLDLTPSINVVKHGGRVGGRRLLLGRHARASRGLRTARGRGGGLLRHAHRREPRRARRARRCSITSVRATRRIPPEAIEKIRAADPAGEFHVYDADHGFNCDQRAAYDAAAASLARQRTLAFLAAHLQAADVDADDSNPRRPIATPGPYKLGVLLVNSGTPDSLDSQRRAALPAPPAARPPHDRGVARDLVLDPLLHHPAAAPDARAAEVPARVDAAGFAAAAALARAARRRCAQHLQRERGTDVAVELGMLYSTPDVRSGLARAARGGRAAHRRAAAVSAVLRHDQRARRMTRWVARCATGASCRSCACCPTMRDEPSIIDAARRRACARTARRNGRGDHLLITFHGIPASYVERGRSLPAQVRGHGAGAGTRSSALRDGDWSLSFQSRVGRAEWLKPYTEDGGRRARAARREDGSMRSARASRSTASRPSTRSAMSAARCSARPAASRCATSRR